MTKVTITKRSYIGDVAAICVLPRSKGNPPHGNGCPCAASECFAIPSVLTGLGSELRLLSFLPQVATLLATHVFSGVRVHGIKASAPVRHCHTHDSVPGVPLLERPCGTCMGHQAVPTPHGPVADTSRQHIGCATSALVLIHGECRVKVYALYCPHASLGASPNPSPHPSMGAPEPALPVSHPVPGGSSADPPGTCPGPAPSLALLAAIPRFSHWVLDVALLPDMDTQDTACALLGGAGVGQSGHPEPCAPSCAGEVCQGHDSHGHAGPGEIGTERAAARAARLHGCPRVAVGLSSNVVEVWRVLPRPQALYRVVCQERCNLYSLRLFTRHTNELLVASGTIFNEILIWSASPADDDMPSRKPTVPVAVHAAPAAPRVRQGSPLVAPVALRLRGHEGSVHALAWHADGHVLASVSDDRTLRVWDLAGVPGTAACSERENSTGETSVAPRFTAFGHTARIWDCAITDQMVVTASEDGTCRVWAAADGKHVSKLHGHQGTSVWRCALLMAGTAPVALLTAGADASLKLWSLERERALLGNSRVPAGADRALLSQPRAQGGKSGDAAALAPGVQPGQRMSSEMGGSGAELGGLPSESDNPLSALPSGGHELQVISIPHARDYARCLALLDASSVLVATQRGLLHHAHVPHKGAPPPGTNRGGAKATATAPGGTDHKGPQVTTLWDMASVRHLAMAEAPVTAAVTKDDAPPLYASSDLVADAAGVHAAVAAPAIHGRNDCAAVMAAEAGNGPGQGQRADWTVHDAALRPSLPSGGPLPPLAGQEAPGEPAQIAPMHGANPIVCMAVHPLPSLVMMPDDSGQVASPVMRCVGRQHHVLVAGCSGDVHLLVVTDAGQGMDSHPGQANQRHGGSEGESAALGARQGGCSGVRHVCSWRTHPLGRIADIFWAPSLRSYSDCFSTVHHGEVRWWRIPTTGSAGICHHDIITAAAQGAEDRMGLGEGPGGQGGAGESGDGMMLAAGAPPGAVLVAVFQTGTRKRVVSLDMSLNERLFVCGDVGGGLTVFELPAEALQEQPGARDTPTRPGHLHDDSRSLTAGAAPGPVLVSPLTELRKAHGTNPVTSVSFAPAHASMGAVSIRTTGRDGTACVFALHRPAQGPPRLKSVDAQRVPGILGPERLLTVPGQAQASDVSQGLHLGAGNPLHERGSFLTQHHQEEAAAEEVIAGFSAAEFILWSGSNQSEVFRVWCGGWRRPWDVVAGPGGRFSFVFGKNSMENQQIVLQRFWPPMAAKSHAGDATGTAAGSEAGHMLSLVGRATKATAGVPGLQATGGQGTPTPSALHVADGEGDRCQFTQASGPNLMLLLDQVRGRPLLPSNHKKEIHSVVLLGQLPGSQVACPATVDGEVGASSKGHIVARMDERGDVVGASTDGVMPRTQQASLGATVVLTGSEDSSVRAIRFGEGGASPHGFHSPQLLGAHASGLSVRTIAVSTHVQSTPIDASRVYTALRTDAGAGCSNERRREGAEACAHAGPHEGVTIGDASAGPSPVAERERGAGAAFDSIWQGPRCLRLPLGGASVAPQPARCQLLVTGGAKEVASLWMLRWEAVGGTESMGVHHGVRGPVALPACAAIDRDKGGVRENVGAVQDCFPTPPGLPATGLHALDLSDTAEARTTGLPGPANSGSDARQGRRAGPATAAARQEQELRCHWLASSWRGRQHRSLSALQDHTKVATRGAAGRVPQPRQRASGTETRDVEEVGEGEGGSATPPTRGAERAAPEDDQRIMASAAFHLGDAEAGDALVFIITGSSDALLLLHGYDQAADTWSVVASLPHHTVPVLAVRVLLLPAATVGDLGAPQHEAIVGGSCQLGAANWAAGGGDTGRGAGQKGGEGSAVEQAVASLSRPAHFTARMLAFSGATDGGVVAWDLTGCVHAFAKFARSVAADGRELKARGPGQGGLLWQPPELRPLHFWQSVHQSGVNCLSVAPLGGSRAHMDVVPGPDGMCTRRTTHVVASGGDDEAVAVLVFSICEQPAGTPGEDNHPEKGGTVPGGIQLQRGREMYRPMAHSSALKGIWTDGGHVLSVGLDQRLRCWCLHAGACSGENLEPAASRDVPVDNSTGASCSDTNRVVVGGRTERDTGTPAGPQPTQTYLPVPRNLVQRTAAAARGGAAVAAPAVSREDGGALSSGALGDGAVDAAALRYVPVVGEAEVADAIQAAPKVLSQEAVEPVDVPDPNAVDAVMLV
eukprot:jgi/Mesvir1/2318/Mv19348-RA.4